MMLQKNHEIIGTLSKIEPNNNNLVLTFSFEKNVEIPKSAIDNQNLNNLIGDRIGVLNYDDKIKIRKIGTGTGKKNNTMCDRDGGQKRTLFK